VDFGRNSDLSGHDVVVVVNVRLRPLKRTLTTRDGTCLLRVANEGRRVRRKLEIERQLPGGLTQLVDGASYNDRWFTLPSLNDTREFWVRGADRRLTVSHTVHRRRSLPSASIPPADRSILQQHEQITASSTDVHRARLQHMESEDLCTCNSQHTAYLARYSSIQQGSTLMALWTVCTSKIVSADLDQQARSRSIPLSSRVRESRV
jgi:hypothetical protein